MRDLSDLNPDVLLASGDRETITEFEESNGSYLAGKTLQFFPTRYDPRVFYPDSSVEFPRLASPRLIIVGRLCWIKGWKLALEALALLRRRWNSIQLTFVGDGEDRFELEKLVDQLDLKNNVQVKGFLEPARLSSELRATDLYLCASIKEGWSVALVEALACGKTCVSTNVSGAREMIVNDENGFIVESREPEEFAKGIERALALLERVGKVNETSLRIAKSFSLDSFAGDWENLWSVLREDKSLPASSAEIRTLCPTTN
ncbi:MAG: glycosyltransferase family 4 protein [Thermoguttaceae bacterium]|nr:glycosyltransferase family 4 protein [Thermoguttaceae bacterium]